MSQLVRKFTVSKSLLSSEGVANVAVIQACYRIKSTLSAHYKQWRIAVTSGGIDIKLMASTGDIVLDTWLSVEVEPGEDYMQWHESLEKLIAFMYMAVPANA